MAVEMTSTPGRTGIEGRRKHVAAADDGRSDDDDAASTCSRLSLPPSTVAALTVSIVPRGP